MRRVRSALTVLLLAVIIAAPTSIRPPQAAAAPLAGGIAWEQLGLGSDLQLRGSDIPSDVSMPVPQGVLAASVSGLIGSVGNLTSGRVDVTDQRGVFLGSIPLPVAVASQPFTIDTAAAAVVDGVATLRFTLRTDDPATTRCARPPTALLSQLAVNFAGATPDPSTVADFLPGYVDTIVIGVGQDPTPAQQQAALTLVANLTHFYRPMPVSISVTTSNAPLPPPPGVGRVIEVRDAEMAGLTVEKGGTPEATLVISGHDEALQRQVQIFIDRRVALAQEPSASVTSVQETPVRAANTMTFGELGAARETSVLESDTLYAGFDTAAFGVGPVERASVHLKAKYTPVLDGEGTMLVRAGNNVLATHRFDGSGAVDLTFDVPAQSLSSNIGLAMELRYFPKRECAPASDRMTFALDPDSTVTVTPGIRNRGGFPALPMAFTPDFDVAIESPTALGYAAQAVNLLGQQSSVRLRPTVKPFDDTVGTSTGLLAVVPGNRLLDSGMNPPVSHRDGIEVGGTTASDIKLDGQLGVIQAFTDHNRFVLAINESAEPGLVQRSFDYIRALPNRWAALSGDVIATGSADQPVSLVVRAGGWVPDRPAATPWWRWWTWLSLALAVAAAAAVVVALAYRRRRSRR